MVPLVLASSLDAVFKYTVPTETPSETLEKRATLTCTLLPQPLFY